MACVPVRIKTLPLQASGYVANILSDGRSLVDCLGDLYQRLDGAHVGLGAGHFQIVHPLKVQPEVGSDSQSLSDSQCRVGSDGPSAVDDIVDAYLGYYSLYNRGLEYSNLGQHPRGIQV